MTSAWSSRPTLGDLLGRQGDETDTGVGGVAGQIAEAIDIDAGQVDLGQIELGQVDLEGLSLERSILRRVELGQVELGQLELRQVELAEVEAGQVLGIVKVGIVISGSGGWNPMWPVGGEIRSDCNSTR